MVFSSANPNDGRPVEIAMERAFWDLTTISLGLVDGAKSAGVFTCQAEKFNRDSPFASNGLTLDYELQCLPTDYDKKARVLFRPGTVTMSLSADGREARFSVTSLRSEVETCAVWLSRHGETVSSTDRCN
jgi:hypothetical protein